MFIAAVIVQDQAVALALRDGEQRIYVGLRLAVDGPTIVAATAAGDLFEPEADGFHRRFLIMS